MVEDDAREQLEARYLGSQPALFAEAQHEWDRFAEQVEGLHSVSSNLASYPVGDEGSALVDAERRYGELVAERARWLADARVVTFERLGEMPRAAAIMERRLLSPA
jgi:hypothetical protein